MGGRKLIIQIPCYNEAETLPITLDDLPRTVPGYDIVEWLIIDDGSTDKTAEVARQHGVDHIVSLRHNQGLARAFMVGIEACVRLGAHTIVNTDADNQYQAKYIPDLVEPILSGNADFVVGCRPVRDIEHFSPTKKLLQRLGSWTVRFASGADVQDAPSGFRAIHWETALHLNVFSNYTYTLETLIQAGRKNIRIKSVPVDVNGVLRPSRLIRSIPTYIRRSIVTILRIFLIYKPFRTFSVLGLLFGLLFLAVFLRGMQGSGATDGRSNFAYRK
jgi:glycosyltransferase involved in cell wall biosynthesis